MQVARFCGLGSGNLRGVWLIYSCKGNDPKCNNQTVMTDTRTIITAASVGLALLSAGWAIYESKHDSPGFAQVAGRASGRAARRKQRTTPRVGGHGCRGKSADSGWHRGHRHGRRQRIRKRHVQDQQHRHGDPFLATARPSGPARCWWSSTGRRRAPISRRPAPTSARARASVNRSRELLATQAVSKSQFEQLEATMKANKARVAAAQARLSDTYIRAPFSGRVGLRRVSLGALISPGTVITTLDDIELHQGRFRRARRATSANCATGRSVTARTNAYPGREVRRARWSAWIRASIRPRAR